MKLNKLKENNKSKAIFLVLTIILSLGISLAAIYYIYIYKDSRENRLVTGLILLDFKDRNVISLDSTVPVIDDVGLSSTPYTFTITNRSGIPINTKIMLDIDNDTNINLGAVRYALFVNNQMIKKDYIHENDLTLYTYEKLGVGESLDCKLYLWVDYYYDRPGETFKAKIIAEGESIDANIQNNLIKVTFDPNGGYIPTTVGYYNETDKYSSLPIPTREGYYFDGWMKNGILKDKNDLIKDDTVESIDDNIVPNINLTAKWIKIYKLDGDYTFTGSNYINTGVYLFNEENFKRNFHISVKIKENNSTVSQSTLINAKYENQDRGYPGFVLRRAGASNYNQISSNINSTDKITIGNIPYESVKIELLMINKILYYRVDNGTFTEVLDFSSFNNYFNEPVTIGANMTNGTPGRFFKGTLSNIVVEFIDDDAKISDYQ